MDSPFDNTKQAQSYAEGGSMTANIDKAGGEGTGAFAKQVIDAYLDNL